ncbi:pro-neuropeptide Y-like isoform X2 [Littorina saxatilis]|uniref:pro-neuropeptide Y-like isoform X2 n=1 Tax=Littorina saxatilis TaxID=31220 RepID=UPI0038B4BF41
MHKVLFSALLVASLFLMEVTCSDTMLSPPERPDEFRSPGELRRYLQALNEYYAIVGRPRFGRSVRTSHKRAVEELSDLKSDE